MAKSKVSHFSYKDEREFEAEYIIPLLESLGYASVVRYHGTREHGKDLIVGEIGRLGHPRFLGIQVKYENISLAQVEGIIADAHQAFRMPFLHPVNGMQERISEFYMMNGGRISTEARDQFYAAVRPAYGANVRLYSGDNMKDIVPHDADLLVGMRHEIEVNASRMRPLLDDQKNAQLLPMLHLRHDAVSTLVKKPSMYHLLDLASNYLQSIEYVNLALGHANTALLPGLLKKAHDAGAALNEKIEMEMSMRHVMPLRPLND
jgi:hypothetical protein